jgi:DnaJ-domain-containing protein 1
MQIGLNELLIILFVIIVAYGFYKARQSSSARSSSYRADQQAANGQTGDSNPTAGGAGSGDPGKRASNAKDPYVVLNVPRNATQDEISASYKKLAQMYHPDKVAGLAPEYYEIAETKMKDINAAYAQIGLKSGAKR